MKRITPFNPRPATAIGATIVVMFLYVAVAGPDANPADTKPDHSNTGAKTATPPEVRSPLTGAELYAIHCNRCHAERYPVERTAAEWKTILTHMRVRANLPAAPAQTILKYLQENSGN